MEPGPIQHQLLEILVDIVGPADQSSLPTGGQIDPHATFTELGMNSVDLLEFVLRVEEQFDTSLLDDIEPQDLPESIAAWAEWLTGKSGGAQPLSDLRTGNGGVPA